MNKERLAEARRIPLPRGDEHQAWVFDTTPSEWVSKTWPTSKAPYRYTPAGVWVRKAMPRNGRMLAPRLLAKLAEFTVRTRGDMHDEFKQPRDVAPESLAVLILAKALVEKDTPFVVYNIEPSGRVWFFSEWVRLASWHPHAPRRDR